MSHPDPGKDDPSRVAAQLISEAWKTAADKGVESELIAGTALSAAIASLIKTHDREEAARIVERLAAAIRAGKFDHKAGPDA